MHESTTLYLIRHGETEWNRIGRWQGHRDVPLSDLGREQARALAERLAREQVRIDAVYASDLRRALETAQILAAPLQLEVVALPALREIDIGPWSGLTRAEIIERFPGAFVEYDLPPGSESHTAFTERVFEALVRLAAEHRGQRIAVVTHGGAVRAALRVMQQLNGDEQPVPHIGNTSITEVRYTGKRWQVLRCNDLRHLRMPQAPDLLAPEPANEADSAV
ncbi:histidine phosphatase family protein [Kallotenue papyrolyticum]|uniref:histidine phosphatase family protein n=1 Tax=Kallotenue papyrolyticum TaxID=1325125 RepID=UPI000478609F|nr:histidine phosphatase family protein [Kallotenue papyrolyticum]